MGKTESALIKRANRDFSLLSGPPGPRNLAIVLVLLELCEMRFYRFSRPFLGLFALAFAVSMSAHGQFWDFLGSTQVNKNQDHGRIQITRSDRLVRTILVRVSGEAIFFDRLVIHFENGASQVIIISDRISPESGNCLIHLPGERRPLKSVELWYYKEPWGKNPRVSLYGDRLPDPDGESIAQEY